MVFELPGHLPFHLEQLKADKELHRLLKQAAAEFVGTPVGVSFRAHAVSSPEPDSAAYPERAPDKDDLLEDDEGAIDPTDLVMDILGGEVVED